MLMSESVATASAHWHRLGQRTCGILGVNPVLGSNDAAQNNEGTGGQNGEQQPWVIFGQKM